MRDIKKEHSFSANMVERHQRDFAAMNEVWNEYVEGDEKGVRACVEAEMAREHILVEIKVIAAVL